MARDRRIAVLTLETASSTGVLIPLKEIRGETLRAALTIWTDRRGARSVPKKGDMSPRDMRTFLRDVMLFDVLDSGRNFRCRVMGDGAVVAWGASFQRMNRTDMNSVQAGMGDVFARVLRACARRQGPIVTRGILWRAQFDECDQETLFPPFSSKDGSIDQVLCVGSYKARQPGTAANQDYRTYRRVCCT